MKKVIWQGPLDDVWVEDEDWHPNWVRLHSVYGTNRGVYEEVKKTDLRSYKRLSDDEARKWINDLIARLDKKRAVLAALL